MNARRPYRIVEGDLLQAKEKYLAHQTNCMSTHAAHLSASVFREFPYADIYSERRKPSRPGTIVIRGDGKKERFVINMLGQYYPGAPKDISRRCDSQELRETYFDRCLQKIAKVPELASIAFPFNIGCGAAGGEWENYREMLRNFANRVREDQGTKVVLYRFAP